MTLLPTFTYGFCLLAVLYYVTSAFFSYWRLRHIRGPPLAAWTDLWLIWAVNSRKGHLYLHSACEQYGSLARIGPNMLVTSDCDLYRKMNAVRTPYTRGDWYKAFRFDADRENLFSETNEEKHIKMRQKVSAGYSGKENPNLEPDMDKVILTMVDLIKKKYISRGSEVKPMDLAIILQYLTLDIITALSLGRAFGWLEDEDKYLYCKTMEDNLPAMTFMSAVPFLSRLLRVPAIQRAVLPSVRDRIGMGKIKAVARETIAERFNDDSTAKEKVVRHDMTQSFITHGLTQAEIADESLLQILAGSDTSGTILRSAFVCIVSNPGIYERLQKECLSSAVPSDEVISWEHVQTLPYLNACVKEALRYLPAATGLGPRKVPKDGDWHNGVYLPPGTEIGVAAWTMQRLNADYGADCDLFRPERWFQDEDESDEAATTRFEKMNKAHELLFSSGRYKCMGERIARMEIAKTMFELIRRFNWAFLYPMKPVGKTENFGLWVQREMYVRAEEIKH